MVETAADKQKRLIQQEIAKLSGKLIAACRPTSIADQQEQSLDTDMEDRPGQQLTQHLRETIHTLREVRLEEEESLVEEEEADHTHWIYDKASPPLSKPPLQSLLQLQHQGRMGRYRPNRQRPFHRSLPTGREKRKN